MSAVSMTAAASAGPNRRVDGGYGHPHESVSDQHQREQRSRRGQILRFHPQQADLNEWMNEGANG